MARGVNVRMRRRTTMIGLCFILLAWQANIANCQRYQDIMDEGLFVAFERPSSYEGDLRMDNDWKRSLDAARSWVAQRKYGRSNGGEILGVDSVGNLLIKRGVDAVGNMLVKRGVDSVGNMLVKRSVDAVGNLLVKRGVDSVGNLLVKRGVDSVGTLLLKREDVDAFLQEPKRKVDPIGNELVKRRVDAVGNMLVKRRELDGKRGVDAVGNLLVKRRQSRRGVDAIGNMLVKRGKTKRGVDAVGNWLLKRDDDALFGDESKRAVDSVGNMLVKRRVDTVGSMLLKRNYGAMSSERFPDEMNDLLSIQDHEGNGMALPNSLRHEARHSLTNKEMYNDNENDERSLRY